MTGLTLSAESTRYPYVCSECGRVGTRDDGISGVGDDCPDEECGGTIKSTRPSSSFRLWSARIGGGRITRYQCVQWAHAVAGPGDYGYQAHGKRTNLTRQEAAALCDQLAEIVERTGDGLALTDDHQEAGRAWMRKHGARVGLPVVGSDGATVEVVRFTFVGAYDYDEGENDWRGIMAPRYRTHLADGRTFDYAPTPWQASAYGQRKLPLWWEAVQS